MNNINKAPAREAVVEFLKLLELQDHIAGSIRQMTAPSQVLGAIVEDVPHAAVVAAERQLDQVESELRGLQPLVEKVAREVDPNDDPYRFVSWASAKKTAQRIIGILDRRPTHDAIFGPRGPSLAANQLHPWVWDAAAGLWEDGHHKQAVLNATIAVEEKVQLKTGSSLSGKDLYGHAFSTNGGSHPRLRFADLAPGTDAWRSAHDGARFLGMGCSQGIRNWAAHSADDVSEQQALEYLAALSVLARWADAAEVDSGASANAA